MNSKGFTMVEVVLTIVLTGILFSTASIILLQGLNSYDHILQRATNLQATRYALERISRELSKVGDTNNTNIQNIQPDRVAFVDTQGASTNFNFSNETLWRGSDLLLNNVTAVTFTGFRDNNNVTNSGGQVRRVRVELSTRPPGQNAPLTLRTDIFIRNYMYENFQ